MIEFWDSETYGNFNVIQLLITPLFVDFPKPDDKKLNFEYVSDTDLLELAKKKTFALSCAISNNGTMIALYCRDRKIRIFIITSGTLIVTIEES